jgi:hypothetical protein
VQWTCGVGFESQPNFDCDTPYDLDIDMLHQDFVRHQKLQAPCQLVKTVKVTLQDDEKVWCSSRLTTGSIFVYPVFGSNQLHTYLVKEVDRAATTNFASFHNYAFVTKLIRNFISERPRTPRFGHFGNNLPTPFCRNAQRECVGQQDRGSKISLDTVP